MAKNDNISFLIKSTFVSAAIALIYSCAAMKSPEGGPRDTTPPKVLKMTPPNQTTNFKEKKIIIEFDEYIKLNNEFKEFSISPELDRIPTLKTKLKKLEITLSDTLETNTTYTLNFGKSIVDLNEGNELKNFSYVFATGPTLDSLSISGNVTNALTGSPEIDATVFILPLSRDSLFGQRKASIFTSTDSSGNFRLNNLKKDTYKIYALKEKNADRIYQQLTDEVAFLKDPLVLNQNIENIELTLFKETAPTFRVTDQRLNADGTIFLHFNQRLTSPEITVIDPKNLESSKIYQFNATNDSVSVWLNDLTFDSTRIVIKNEGKALDTVKISRNKRDTYTRVIQALDNLEGGILAPFRDLTLTFNLPIISMDQSKIVLLEDSIPKTFSIQKDSLNQLKYHIKYKWRPKERYELIFKDAALTSIFATKNKEFKKSFTLGDGNDYGSLKLTIETPDSTKSYILEIVDKDKKLISRYSISERTVVTLPNYKQGIYYARIVYDTNKNGIWDTGNVKAGVQPEVIWYEPKELSIRANWDREEVIKIPLLPFKNTQQKNKTNQKSEGAAPLKEIKDK